MHSPRFFALLLGAAALAFTSVAAAKEFRPGDLRVCNAKRCVGLTDQAVLNVFSSFYYRRSAQPSLVRSPRLGAPYFQLRFRQGYVTGIVATTQLDRFLSYGVNLDQFQRGKWYRVPPRAAFELRMVTAAAGLKPLRLTQAAVGKSH
jgi:hypothetical protein